MLTLNTNVSAMRAASETAVGLRRLSSTSEKLSTGMRINSAGQDAAGLGIASRMTAQFQGLAAAIRNTHEGINLMQTAEGATHEIEAMMQRMRELAVQASTDTYTAQDRQLIDLEFQALKKQMVRIGRDTTWNGIPVLDPTGRASAGVVPATISSLGPIDTSGPATGTYSLYLNGVDVPIQLVAGEPAQDRLTRVLNAVNASTPFHGVSARTSTAGGVELYTRDGSDLSAWYDSSISGLKGVSFGLGDAGAAQVSTLQIQEIASPALQMVQTDSYIQFSGLGESGETISMPTSATASTQAGALSLVNGVLYRGDGTSATRMGTIDATRNGQNGQPLRFNLEASFENGDFETGSVGATTFLGWTAGNQRVRLNGADMIGGWPTPTDTLPAPQGNGETVSQSPATYTTQMTGSGLQAGSTLGIVLRSSSMTIDSFGVSHGPYVISDNPVTLAAGDSVSFDWRAQGGDDDYDVYAYLLNVDNGNTVELLNSTGGYTNWATVSKAVTAAGNYRFVFISGTYDRTGGTAAGAQLYLDNIKVNTSQVQGELTQQDVQALSASLLYSNAFTASVTIGGQQLTSASSTSAEAAATSLQAVIQQAITGGQVGGITSARTGSTITLTGTALATPFSVSGASVTSVLRSATLATPVDARGPSDQITGIPGATAQSTGAAVVQGVPLSTSMVTAARSLVLHIGASAGQSISLELADFGADGDILRRLAWDGDEDALLRAQALAGNGAVVSSQGDTRSSIVDIAAAADAIVRIDQALGRVLEARASMGATINRLTYVTDNLRYVSVNVASSRSHIMDTDYAAETAELARRQILYSAANATVAQANSQPGLILDLLAPR